MVSKFVTIGCFYYFHEKNKNKAFIMKRILIFLIGVIGYCSLYSQDNFDPFGGIGRMGSVSFVIDNTVYIGLGENGNTFYKDFWKHSLTTNSWERIADFPGDARTNSNAFSINGMGYVGLGSCSTADTTFQDLYSYNPTTDEWTKLNDFNGGFRTKAVCFVIGSDAYIGTGNDKDGNSQKDFWKYNYSTDTWIKLTATFSGDIRQSASAFTINGKGYVVGGCYFSDYTVQLSDIQEYNPVTNTWTEKIFADGINLSFNDATAFGYYGKGYICYGNKNTVVKYNPFDNSIENLGNILNLEDVRISSINFILNDTAYVGLGLYTHDDGSMFGQSIYDNGIYKLNLPKANPPSDIILSNDTIVEYLPDNSLVGSFSTIDEDVNSMHTYTLVNDVEYPDNASFTIVGSSLYAKSMRYYLQNTFEILVRSKNDNNGLYVEKPFTVLVKKEHFALGVNPFKGTAREDAVCFTIGDTVYVGLGRSTNYTPVDDFWKYSLSTNRWERIKPFPGGKRTAAVAFTIGNLAYVGLGYGDNYNNTQKDFYSYNPATNSWTRVADFGGIDRCCATAFVIDGIAYVGLGERRNDQLSDFWKYDPIANSWIQTSAFSGGKRSSSSSFSFNGKGYVVGGFYTVSALITPYGDINEYDPATGNWVKNVSYNSNLSRSYSGTAFVFRDNAYICYGGNTDVVEYNPLSDEFKNFGNLVSFSDERNGPISFVIGDSAYIGLGRDMYLATKCKNDISVIKFPENPTDINLSNNTIKEHQFNYTLVGNLTAVDKSGNVNHTFELYDNDNYPDNSSFYIAGNSLKAMSMDYQTKNVYKISIKVTNNYGLSFDKEFTILVLSTVDVETPKDVAEFSVYPNPVKSILNISHNGNAKVLKLEIYNIYGSLVLSSAYMPSIDISKLSPAYYQLRIVTNKKIYCYPIIVE